MPVRLTVYDGAGVVGGNKILLEADGTALFLDFGLSFDGRGRFFEEFLTPRAALGIVDLLVLDLLPPLRGIYRPDAEPPGRGHWEAVRRRNPGYREGVRVDAVLLSHAHVDHCGWVGLLDPAIPVVATLATAVIAKAFQDTAPGDLEGEVAYVAPREVVEGLLRASDYRKVPYRQRRFLIADRDGGLDGLDPFWRQPGTARPLDACPPAPCGGRVGNLEVRCWPVDHSIPGAAAFGVRTSEGWVVYTGDLRLHGARAEATRRFAAEAGRLEPLALIAEGTHVHAARPAATEEEVYLNALRAVRESEGQLVIADFGPRNVERLLTFRRIARETGRQLAITARDAYLLEALHLADPEVPDPRADETFVVYAEAKVQRPGWERVVLERYGPRAVTAARVRRSPGDYVLCLGYYELTELVDLDPDGGAYIYSSSEAFNEEMQIDHDRLASWLRHFRLRLYGGLRARAGPRPGEPDLEELRAGDRGFHASGHIHGPGLLELIETVGPRYLIPVHTAHAGFFLEHFGSRRRPRLIWPRRGEAITLPDGA